MTKAESLVEIWRGPFLESLHRGHAVVWQDGGGIVASWGDPGQVILPRSSCKMIQALPLVESGAEGRQGAAGIEGEQGLRGLQPRNDGLLMAGPGQEQSQQRLPDQRQVDGHAEQPASFSGLKGGQDASHRPLARKPVGQALQAARGSTLLVIPHQHHPLTQAVQGVQDVVEHGLTGQLHLGFRSAQAAALTAHQDRPDDQSSVPFPGVESGMGTSCGMGGLSSGSLGCDSGSWGWPSGSESESQFGLGKESGGGPGQLGSVG